MRLLFAGPAPVRPRALCVALCEWDEQREMSEARNTPRLAGVVVR
jgi:hypothetical protein